MRVQFVLGYNYDNPLINIDVGRVPTEEESKKIEEEIITIMEKHKEENGDFVDFDYYKTCKNTVEKYVPLIENIVVKTIYL